MMLDYFIAPSITRAHYFKVQFTPQGYACVDARGSLRPVPFGMTRRELYCGQCRAEMCLLPHSSPLVAGEKKHNWEIEPGKRQQRYRKSEATQRAKGFSIKNQPLKQTCWNCAGLRIKLSGYVCRLEPESEPKTQGAMVHRHGDDCEDFDWRLGEIPQLEE